MCICIWPCSKKASIIPSSHRGKTRIGDCQVNWFGLGGSRSGVAEFPQNTGLSAFPRNYCKYPCIYNIIWYHIKSDSLLYIYKYTPPRLWGLHVLETFFPLLGCMIYNVLMSMILTSGDTTSYHWASKSEMAYCKISILNIWLVYQL